MGRHKNIPKQRLLIRYAFQRDLQGNLAFDYEKDHYRSPLYLLRNIKQVLRHHEKRLNILKGTGSTRLDQMRTNSFKHAQPSKQVPSLGGDSSQSSFSDSQKALAKQGDAFPAFADYVKDDSVKVYSPNFKSSPQLRLGQAALLLNITHICTKSDSNTASAFNFYKVQSSRCNISVCLLDQGSDRLRPAARQTRECALTMESSGKIMVSLEQPFKFGIEVSQGSRYHMEIRFSSARDGRSPWPPMKVATRFTDTSLSLMTDSQLQTFPDGLVATYTDFPLHERAHERVRIMYIGDGAAYKTRHALEVGIDWVAAPLQSVAELQQPSNTRMKTHPTGLSGFPQENSKVAVPEVKTFSRIITSYTLASTEDKKVAAEWRKVSFRGFHCPCCLRVFSDFDSIVALRFHLITAHVAHNFVLQEVKPSTRKDIEYEFTVSATSRKVEKITYIWPMTWIAPSTPLNVSSYVNGDESWLGPKSTLSVKAPVATNENPIAALRRKHNGILPAQYVEEIPIRQRKKYPVVPTKTRDKLPIFTSVTHRQLQPDEELSESDEDVDETWLRDKHAQQIMDMTYLSLEERKFQIRWNDHVRSEGLPHTFYLSDVLVRWVRKDREWLRSSNERLSLYHRFERGLRDREKISDLVARGCWGILYGKAPVEKKQTAVAVTEVNGV